MIIADRKAPTEEATGSAKLRLAGGLGVSVRGLMPEFAIVLKVELLVSSEAAKHGIRSTAAAIVTSLAIVAVSVLVRIANGTTRPRLRPSPSSAFGG